MKKSKELNTQFRLPTYQKSELNKQLRRRSEESMKLYIKYLNVFSNKSVKLNQPFLGKEKKKYLNYKREIKISFQIDQMPNKY